MTTYPAVILSLLLVAIPVTVLAQPAPNATVPPEFVRYKALGDAEREAGHWQAALVAYGKALDLRKDPEVVGRVGVVLFKLGKFDKAAHQLSSAINDSPTALSKEELAEFSRVFSDAQREVCRVDIKVTQANAQVEIDTHSRAEGLSDFRVYLMPGAHTFRAHLEGFADAFETLVTERNCQRNVTLALRALPSAPRAHDTRDESTSKDPLYGAKPPTNHLKPSVESGFLAGGLLWFPFGITPGFPLGVQAHGAWRSRSWWEVGLDVRVATTLGNGFFELGSAYTWSMGFVPCARAKGRFFGCALVQVDGGAAATTRASWLSLGFGARGRYDFRLHKQFYATLQLDALVHPEAPQFGTGNVQIWAGTRLAVVPGIGIFTFF